jgi:hypothetical protein
VSQSADAVLDNYTVVQLLEHTTRRLRLMTQNHERPVRWTGDDIKLHPDREFNLAITALEDAQMRYTRGRAIELDRFNPADLDA